MDEADTRKRRRIPPPLDGAGLEEMALRYVARYATTTAKLRDYLGRKLRERGWAGMDAPDVAGLVARHAALGHVDDAAFAMARSAALSRRGYGARRVAESLAQAGIAADLREDARPDEAEQRAAALALARRRGFGPFAAARSALPLDRERREKQLAAMLRAGHTLTHARQVIDAPDAEAAREWAAGGED